MTISRDHPILQKLTNTTNMNAVCRLRAYHRRLRLRNAGSDRCGGGTGCDGLGGRLLTWTTKSASTSGSCSLLISLGHSIVTPAWSR
jgi:hypothetical protein